MGTEAKWEILAIRYGTVERPVHELQLDADPHEGAGRLDYFIWVIRRPEGDYIFDTGFEPGEAAARGRTMLVHPAQALAEIGINASEVRDVIISHLHYDHAGNLNAFPTARFHLQDREMAYGTGRCMCHARMRRPFSVADVVQAVQMVFAERVVFHDGDTEIAPGLSLHLIGGHSRGLQVVRIESAGGIVVLASDALHVSRFLETKQVFPVFADFGDILDGYRRLRELAGPDGRIVPGHDPALVETLPRLPGPTADILVIA